MTAVILNPAGGTNIEPAVWCIDAAGMKTTTDYVPVWERGFRGMSGYIAGAYDIPTACIEAWWSLPDTWWMLNYERDPRAGLGGASVGIAYAADGVKRIRDKGHQGETALIFSLVDFGPTAPQFPILDETHQAVIETCQELGQERIGFYGPPIYLRHLALMPWVPVDLVFWQWGGGGAPEWWTTAKQAGPNSTPPLVHDLSGFGFAADENRLFAPMAGWTGYGTTPQPQPPNGDPDVLIITNAEPYPQWEEPAAIGEVPPDGANWPAGWVRWMMMPDGNAHDPKAGSKRWLHGAEYAAYAGQPATALTTGQIQSIAGYTPAWPCARLTGVQIDSVPGRAAAVYS